MNYLLIATIILLLLAIAGCVQPVCGNGKCERGESRNCPKDCEAPAVLCGDSKCGSGETAANCPDDCEAQVGNCKRWNPGHYLLLDKRRTIEEIEAVLSNPENHIKGIQIGVWWRDLEPEKDVYNFSIIERYLTIAKKQDKQLFLQFMERTFDNERPIPDYLYEDPRYNGGAEPFIGREGSVARIWDPAVMGRMNKVITELGKRFDNDPNFEGINFAESAVDVERGNATEFYQALGEQMKSKIDNAAAAFPNSVVIQYMNYGPKQFLDAMIPYLYSAGAGMGGPDLVPDEGRFPTKERIPAYDYYPTYAGKMPLGTAVQEPNLMKDDKNKKGYFTLDGFWGMGLNTLKLNYIFWAFVEESWHKFSFTNDILPYINERDGQINAGCPENRVLTGPQDYEEEPGAVEFEPIQVNSLIGTFWTTTPAEINRLKGVGGSWSKPIFYWRRYERDGISYINEFDSQISLIKDTGLEPIVVISGGNVPPGQDCLNKKHYLGDKSYCSEEEFNAAVENFVEFAEKVVTRFQGVRIFQIMIEPNSAEEYKIDFEPEVYAEILHKTYPRLKAIRPDSLIFHGGWAVHPLPDLSEQQKRNSWIYKMYQHQKNKYGRVFTDAVAVHPFMNYEKPEDGLLEVLKLHHELGEQFNVQYNGKTYVIVDEFAYSTCTGGGDAGSDYPVGRWPSSESQTEQLQANYWTRAILLMLSTDYVPRVLWASTVLDVTGTKQCMPYIPNFFSNSGAYKQNGAMKKSGIMVKSLTDILRDYRFSRNLIEGDNGTYAIEFDKNGRKLIAVWNADGARTVDLSQYTPSKQAKIKYLATAVDEKGNPTHADDETAPANSIPITETPVFVE